MNIPFDSSEGVYDFREFKIDLIAVSNFLMVAKALRHKLTIV